MLMALLCSLLAGQGPEMGKPIAKVSPKAARAFAERLWQTEAFVASSQWRVEKKTLRQFFEDKDYRRLRGNEILGYWAVDQGFDGAGEVELTMVKTILSCQPVKDAAWRAAFRVANGRAPSSSKKITLQIACLEAVYAPTTVSPPGVLLELMFADSVGRRFLYRSAVGKQTLEAAMVASFDWAIQLARTVESTHAN